MEYVLFIDRGFLPILGHSRSFRALKDLEKGHKQAKMSSFA